MRKKRILLTGATGNMGREGLKQLCENRDQYDIVVFSLPTKKDWKLLRKFLNVDGVTVVWGDLRNFEDVKVAVSEVDIVLHVGAFVSPAADHNPKLAMEINFGGTKNIVDAIRERKDCDSVKLVYIGTVAETGNRAAPYHWGRVGDPIIPSVYDYYALSKIAAERYVIESGLKNWVSLRQTGILHHDILKVNDGIGYHQPLNNHLEWVTAFDSGRLLLNVCSADVSPAFWRRVYNIGGGDACRLTAYQFTDRMFNMMGVNLRDLEDPNWYALRNFHGQWYLDSDELESFVHYRSEGVDDILEQLKKKLPFSMKALKYLPKKLVKKRFMKPQASTKNSPLYWIENNEHEKVIAFFGSKDNWDVIGDWDSFEPLINPDYQLLNHGYDEKKEDKELTLDDLKDAAHFRGGECLARDFGKDDFYIPLKWICAYKHEFEASPFLILKTGHWCPECTKSPWNFDHIAKANPFIAQLWYNDHEIDENMVYQ